MLDEVIICEQCGVEFHQSFISAHVEAFHVEAKQEEIVTLSCVSCAYTVGAQHKNTMIQHCYATGHSIHDVEVHFNSFLIAERTRIGRILETGFEILKSQDKQSNQNCTPITRKSPPRKRKVEETFKKSESLPNRGVESGFETEATNELEKYEPFQLDLGQIKQEIPEVSSSPKREDQISCTKCDKTITITKIKSHTLSKAVGHVLTHLTHLQLFRCQQCGLVMRRLNRMRDHLKKIHKIDKVSKENVIGSEQDVTEIRSTLKLLFPRLTWNPDLDILKYA